MSRLQSACGHVFPNGIPVRNDEDHICARSAQPLRVPTDRSALRDGGRATNSTGCRDPVVLRDCHRPRHSSRDRGQKLAAGRVTARLDRPEANPA